MRLHSCGATCLFVVAVVSLCWLYASQAKSEPPSPAAEPDLAARVAQLEGRVLELENRLVEHSRLLEKLRQPTASDLIIPYSNVPAPQPALPPGIPRDAVPKEFNGSTFYYVPLAEQPSRQ